MRGFFLFIIAIISFILIVPLALIFGIIKGKLNFKYYAISIDQTLNAICGNFLDHLFLIDRSIFKFGDMDKTISYNLGRNKYFNNLNNFGKLIVFILHKIDKDHVDKVYNEGI